MSPRAEAPRPPLAPIADDHCASPVHPQTAVQTSAQTLAAAAEAASHLSDAIDTRRDPRRSEALLRR